MGAEQEIEMTFPTFRLLIAAALIALTAPAHAEKLLTKQDVVATVAAFGLFSSHCVGQLPPALDQVVTTLSRTIGPDELGAEWIRQIDVIYNVGERAWCKAVGQAIYEGRSLLGPANDPHAAARKRLDDVLNYRMGDPK
jgi:hypothetical protein